MWNFGVCYVVAIATSAMSSVECWISASSRVSAHQLRSSVLAKTATIGARSSTIGRVWSTSQFSLQPGGHVRRFMRSSFRNGSHWGFSPPIEAVARSKAERASKPTAQIFNFSNNWPLAGAAAVVCPLALLAVAFHQTRNMDAADEKAQLHPEAKQLLKTEEQREMLTEKNKNRVQSQKSLKLTVISQRRKIREQVIN